MKSFHQFVQHHRRLRPIAPGPRPAKNSAGSPNATMLDGATQAVSAAWLLLVSIHERRGDVPRKQQHRVSQAVETCLGIIVIPLEISTGALSPPGQAPAPAECLICDTKDHGVLCENSLELTAFAASPENRR